MSASPALQAALQKIGAKFQAITGTIHVLGADGQLHLAASFGLPETLQPVVKIIPVGKGIAGAAAQRREPVAMCNLQNDQTGIARPDARSTGVGAAIAVPILAGETLVGVLGIGRAQPQEFTLIEIDELMQAATELVECGSIGPVRS